MRFIHRVIYALLFIMLLLRLAPALAMVFQEAKAPQPAKPELPLGDGRDLLVKNCSGCHQLMVVTSQHKSESGWTDTIVEMRNRGANGSDEDMEHIIRYLTANFGPTTASSAIVNVNSASASDIVTGLSLPHADADAIVAYRTKSGKFKDIDGLKQVPGIDPAKIDAAKDRIQF
jgi:competence ComEA-like helix-hairpin-helix protein